MAAESMLLTADDLLQVAEDDCHDEVLDGVLLRLPLPSHPRGRAQATIAPLLIGVAQPHTVGYVLGRTGFILRRDLDRVRAPDVCFIAREHSPSGGLGRGFIDLAPDLVVEIASPSDRRGDIEAKAQGWLDFGTRLVWLVRTEPRTVTVYTPGSAPRVLTEADTLTAEPVLPGFSAPLRELFA